MDKPLLNIVKIGGRLINDQVALDRFLNDFSQLEGAKVLIHGGGSKATDLADQIGLEPKMINGRRITDTANLEVVLMVYAGLVNKKIIAELQKNKCNAIGLSGADANIIQAHKREVSEIDYGYAGDIDQVDKNTVKLFLTHGITPVFCAITHDSHGQLLNTNADTVASEIASALSGDFQVVLTYCFDKKGVLKDVTDENSVIKELNTQMYMSLKQQHMIADGMLPKLFNCFYALNKGVSKIRIGRPSVIVDRDQLHTTVVL